MEAKETRQLQSDVESIEPTVKDVMRARPKTLPVTATVSDLRRLFANTHVLTALIVDGEGAFAGVVERAGFAAGELSDGGPITDLIRAGVDAIDVRAPASEVWKHHELTRTGRLVVLEPDGRTLAGLVCVCETSNGGLDFCR